jgi:hypothetical protein
MIIGIRARGHAACIRRVGRDAGQEMRRRPLLVAWVCTVTGRGKGNSPLADRWVPLTIEIRRNREGVPAGPDGLRGWLILGFAVHSLRDQGPSVDFQREEAAQASY